MSIRKLRARFPALALLAGGLALLGSPTSSQAGIMIEAKVNGGNFFTLASSANAKGPIGFTGTVSTTTTNPVSGAVFEITGLSATSNSPGTFVTAFGLSSTAQVKNLSSSTTRSITFRISATDFANPSVPPGTIYMTNSIGGSVLAGRTANALNFQSYVNTANNQQAQGISPGALTPPITLAGSYNDDNVANPLAITSLASGYSIVQEFTITLGGGGNLGFSTNTTLNAVPEPGTIASAVAGLPLLGLGYWMRRRKV